MTLFVTKMKVCLNITPQPQLEKNFENLVINRWLKKMKSRANRHT